MDERRREIQRRVDSHMEDALYRAFERVWEDIDDEKYSKEEAERAMTSWDMSDYFTDWWAEGE